MKRGWGVILPELPLIYESLRLNQSAIGPWDWGFNTVRGGVDPGEIGFCPRGVGL